MMAHGMEYLALFGQVGSACPAVSLPEFPSWIPVKINPVLVEHRTQMIQALITGRNLGIIWLHLHGQIRAKSMSVA